MAAVTAITEYQLAPGIDKKMIVMSYSKASANDYITVSSYGIRTILWASAKDDTAGADDVCTWSNAVLTFTGTGTLTGSGTCIIVGSS